MTQHLCTGEPLNMDDCLYKWNWGLLSDPVLSEIEQCQELACGRQRRASCVNDITGTN
jgi:hypothetical protein